MEQEPIAKNVQEMFDEHAIKNIAHLFARGLDRADRALIEACFHEDGTDDHGVFKGTVKEFCDWVFPQLDSYTATQHIISTQIAKVNGDKGVCESYFYARHALPTDDGPKELIAAGRYIDTMEKRGGIWKIKHRKAVFDWNRIDSDYAIPARPEMDKVMTKGARGEEDVSYAAFAAI
ncbi:MAG: hypothetical protein Hens3KO_20520 [Henriciella sp.]